MGNPRFCIQLDTKTRIDLKKNNERKNQKIKHQTQNQRQYQMKQTCKTI
jgi:hypothetical protein